MNAGRHDHDMQVGYGVEPYCADCGLTESTIARRAEVWVEARNALRAELRAGVRGERRGTAERIMHDGGDYTVALGNVEAFRAAVLALIGEDES